MRLIFIRHAEPDYEHHTLTEKGFREAEILSHRVSRWKNIDRIYTSPLERAKFTARPSLDKMGRTAVELDWMKEFSYAITDPTTGKLHAVPWDFMPQFWTEQPLLHDKDNFYRHPLLQSNPGYEKAVMTLRRGIDGILSEYGYHRSTEGGYYLTDDTIVGGDDEKTVLFFAHLGANCEAIGYLIGISPVVLQQATCMAPTSITVLNAEKRQPGIAMFRAQVIGDASHLREEGEPISYYGAFSEVFQG